MAAAVGNRKLVRYTVQSSLQYQLLSLKLCFQIKITLITMALVYDNSIFSLFHLLYVRGYLNPFLCSCWTGSFVYHLFYIAYVFRLHTFAVKNNTCVHFMFMNKFIMMNPIHLERENQVSLCTCVENCA